MGDDLTDQQGRVWLERGVAAARAGRRTEAREALFRALNYETQREMAWLWLAAVADDRRQERMYLEKVLSLNPDNSYAKSGVAKLDEALAVEQARVEATPPAPKAEASLVVPPAAPAKAAPAGSSPARTVQEAKPTPVSPPQPKTAQETKAASAKKTPAPQPDVARKPPAPKPPSGVKPPAQPRATGQQEPLAAQQALRKEQPPPVSKPAKVEPSGWTTESSPVKPARPPAPRVEPADVMRSEPSLRRAPRARGGRPAPRVRGGLVGLAAEAFQSYEIWTVVMVIAGLLALAVYLGMYLILYRLAG